jgi:hypothetical protein
MSAETGIPVILNLRALLVIAALICLCVSSNVGLQLFPLPAAPTQVTLDVQLSQASKAVYAPQADAKSFRVPMVVQSKKRADKEPPHSNPFVALRSDRFNLPRETRFAIKVDYAVRVVPSVKMAPRAGRAPPALV